uniref:Ovule protein n=1 Tax=Gongylonema pulchrum TaxID=637853 RepID=A0A183F1E9_9BILA
LVTALNSSKFTRLTFRLMNSQQLWIRPSQDVLCIHLERSSALLVRSRTIRIRRSKHACLAR